MEREFKELSKSAPEELVHERVLPDGSRVKSWGPFVYGYSVTIGPEGKPQVREFGNVTPKSMLGKPKIDVKEKREPLVDVLESEDNINIIAELPGVAKENIDLTGKQNSITISVDTSDRKYYKELQLPCEVDLENAKSEYKNGVLEVVLKKTKEEKPVGRKLKVD
jgi:HSP20 family protein